MRFLKMLPIKFDNSLQKSLEGILSYSIFGGMAYRSFFYNQVLIGIIPEVIVDNDYNLSPIPKKVRTPLEENLMDLITFEELHSTFENSPEIILFNFRNKNPFSKYDSTHFLRLNLLNHTVEPLEEESMEYYNLRRAYGKIREEVIELYWNDQENKENF